MSANEKPDTYPKGDLLDELIENGDVDEVGLLDLIFIEEILNQDQTPASSYLFQHGIG